MELSYQGRAKSLQIFRNYLSTASSNFISSRILVAGRGSDWETATVPPFNPIIPLESDSLSLTSAGYSIVGTPVFCLTDYSTVASGTNYFEFNGVRLAKFAISGSCPISDIIGSDGTLTRFGFCISFKIKMTESGSVGHFRQVGIIDDVGNVIMAQNLPYQTVTDNGDGFEIRLIINF